MVRDDLILGIKYKIKIGEKNSKPYKVILNGCQGDRIFLPLSLVDQIGIQSKSLSNSQSFSVFFILNLLKAESVLIN